jgi:hypothetical protein
MYVDHESAPSKIIASPWLKDMAESISSTVLEISAPSLDEVEMRNKPAKHRVLQKLAIGTILKTSIEMNSSTNLKPEHNLPTHYS